MEGIVYKMEGIVYKIILIAEWGMEDGWFGQDMK
jgi:hypothetical protein